MAFSAQCPSCGAPVVFRSAASVLAVCEYCQSTLVRQDQALADIGKMAALAEDRSPLQLGASGRYRDQQFSVLGRIQLRYSQGLWNEWFLLFDDQRSGWLSEAGGEYVLSFAEPVQEPIPGFSELQVGQRLHLAGQAWTVTNLEQAECVAGQGELPFRVGPGYPVPAADLRNLRHFATLDYSESPPLVFVGEAVKFSALAWSGLRAEGKLADQVVEARVFRCPTCASPMQARSREILAAGCANCGTVVDTSDDTYQRLSRAIASDQQRYLPLLPLGTRGRLAGEAVEVIGFLVRRCTVAGANYDWREYLLAAPEGRYRWLTEYDGHWNLADPISDLPIQGSELRYRGEVYRHFQSAEAVEVIQVAGEFTWRVRCGEQSQVSDYVAPPLMLSREQTANELTWTVAEYLVPEMVKAAFNLPADLPEPQGIYANQPNPWQGERFKIWSLAGKFVLTALVLQVIFLVAFHEKLWLRQDFSLQPGQGEVLSKPFVLPGGQKRLLVRNQTSLDNNWMGLDLVLVNKDTGQSWPTAREIAFFQGYDDGYWSEGKNQDEVVFRDIPPGTYYLSLEPEIAPEKPQTVNNRLEVVGGGLAWSNFLILIAVLLSFPAFSEYRIKVFETRRWLESDHPPAEAGEDD